MFVLKKLRSPLLGFSKIIDSHSCAAYTSPFSNAAEPDKAQNTPAGAYGQPTAWTHPHLIKTGELVPGICVEEFQSRRTRLMKGIQKFAIDSHKTQKDNYNHIVVIPSATKKYMSDKIPYVFRQNSDFYYLTGCLEPDSVLLMTIDEKGDVRSSLFMRPKDMHAELWEGARTGVDNAVDLFGVDESYPNINFHSVIDRIVSVKKPRLWYDLAQSEQSGVTENLKSVMGTATLLSPATNFVQSMRLFKSPAEQELMRQTCQIASESINEVMRETRSGHTEHQINALVDYKCRMRGASYLAYPPVVAAGNNATTIHYISNSQMTNSGDLVLLDAGCEYGGYTSDITRTWPVNGLFTEPQKILYDIVYLLQTELIGSVLEKGGETLDNLFESMCKKLGKYLQEAGLVPKDVTSDNDYTKAGYKFCPHHVSHFLGMDVHDTPLMPRTLRLLPGMVFTVEPGIYIGANNMSVPKEFRGIGIRIEDDILITDKSTVEVLTAKCIKERCILESLFKEKRSFKFKP